MIDVVDRALINALQILPRASWKDLSIHLNADPATLGRRWSALVKAGFVRATAAFRGAVVLAHIDLSCAPKDADRMAEQLAHDPRVLTVFVAAGEFNVVFTLACASLAALSHFLVDEVGRMPGVHVARTHVQVAGHIEGSTWEARALPDAARRELVARRSRVDPAAAVPRHLTAAEYTVYRRLVEDGRSTYADIADTAEVSISTARRTTESLLASGLIRPRVHIARAALGLPVTVSLQGSTPWGLKPVTARLREEVPEIGYLARVAGQRNLLAYAWLADLEDLFDVERRLSAIIPDLVVEERGVMLRIVKLVGHILDERGRSIEAVALPHFV